MISKNMCIPKKYNYLKLIIGLIILTFEIFILLSLIVIAIFNIMAGNISIPTFDNICILIFGLIFFFILWPLVIIATIREFLITGWIKVGDDELHILKRFRWEKIPYKDISEVNINEDDLEILFNGIKYILKRDDLNDCYNFLLSRLHNKTGRNKLINRKL